MRTYFVIQNIASFRIDWRCLYRPDEYRLVLITSEVHHARLQAAGQFAYFDRVVKAESFLAEDLTATLRGLMHELGVSPDQVRVACHDEYTLAAAAAAREALDIPGARLDEVRRFVNKLEMKAALVDRGVRVPRHVAWDGARYAQAPDATLAEIEAALGYPMFVKPVNESGSVGTARLETRAEIAAWCEQHRDATGYEIDEWITGKLYHCDSIIRGGRVLYTQLSEYAHPCYEYLQGKICASITLPENDPIHARLTRFTSDVLDALRPIPSDSVTHLEVFRTPADELVFLEIAARAPAALVPFTYARYLGWNIEEVHFRLQMGLLDNFVPKFGPYAAWVYYPQRTGTVVGVTKPALRSTFLDSWNIKAGDIMSSPANIREAAMSMQLWNDDYQALRADFEALDRFEPFSVR